MSKNNYYSDDLTIQASQGYLYDIFTMAISMD